MKKQITKEQYLADVMSEIENIKKYAKEEEKEKLDEETFNPSYVNRCVYGQMTGNCQNKRAYTLINKCCKRIFDLGEDSESIVHLGKTEKSLNFLNGKFKGQGWDKELQDRDFQYLSSLEGYILIHKGKYINVKILSYIKGEINELTLI